MTALLSIQGLNLGYGRTQVVRSLDLDVADGSLTCLIGANGAGKTTILKGISGLMKRTGRTHFAGRDITALPAHRIARLGLTHVPEGRQIFTGMTVAENLRMGGYLADAGERRRRFDEVVTLFPRLGERLHQIAGLLSGGEQQMLALGRALMSGPRLLLLDEPSMGLSPLLVEQIFAVIADLRRQGRTILLVEQNAHLALELADHAYVLKNGRILLQGPAADIRNDPTVLAAYLGG